MAMKRKRYTEPQIVFALQQAGAGQPFPGGTSHDGVQHDRA